MRDVILTTIRELGYTVDTMLKQAARYEMEGQRTLARVVFEDAMLLDAANKREELDKG